MTRPLRASERRKVEVMQRSALVARRVASPRPPESIKMKCLRTCSSWSACQEFGCLEQLGPVPADAEPQAAAPEPISEIAAERIPTVDRAGDGPGAPGGQAPEGTSGGSAARSCDGRANACPPAQPTLSPRARIDLAAVPSAMDARFARSVAVAGRVSTSLDTSGEGEADDGRAEPCGRCEARWPIVKLHPIISACIERPCPMRAMLR